MSHVNVGTPAPIHQIGYPDIETVPSVTLSIVPPVFGASPEIGTLFNNRFVVPSSALISTNRVVADPV
jgi:hypothetical protein